MCLAFVAVSCRNTWSQEDKDAFYQACTDDAKTWAGSAGNVKTYCDCVFAKMEKKFPNENDALDHIDELTKDTSLLNCRKVIMK